MNNHPSTVPSTSSHTALGLGRRHRARGATLQEDAVALSSRLCGENACEKAGEGGEEEQEFGGLQALSVRPTHASHSLLLLTLSRVASFAVHAAWPACWVNIWRLPGVT